jgi:O-antigen/teichoic acid export membrane protein
MITWGFGQVVMVVRMAVYYQYLGEAGYGLWFLAFAIMSYFVFYNFGINNAFIKYTAEFYAKNDFTRLNHILGTGYAAALAIGAAIALVFLLFTDQVIAFFSFEPENAADAYFVVRGIGLATACSIGLGVYNAVLTGLQRLVVLNTCRVTFLTLETGLAFLLLWQGMGIRMLVVLYTVSLILSYIVMAIAIRRYAPDIRINPFLARVPYLKDMVSLGGRMQLLGAVSLVVSTIDGLLFAKMQGLAFVGMYAIARRVSSRAQGAALQAFGALTPASADLHARGDREKLTAVYDMALRITTLGASYLFGFLAINSDYTMLLFQGGDKYSDLSAWALTVLSGALAIHTLTGPGSSMLRGAGVTAREISYHVITLVLFLGFYFGAEALGYSSRTLVMTYPAALAVGSLFFIVIANHYYGSRLLAPFDRMILLIPAGPLLAWVVRLGYDALQLDLPWTRWYAIPALFMLGVPFTGLFALAALFVPGLPAADKQQLIRFVPGGRKFARRFLRHDEQ